MLTRIDENLFLNFRAVIALERENAGVIVRFASGYTDSFDGPRAKRVWNAFQSRQNTRRAWLAQVDARLRKWLGIN